MPLFNPTSLAIGSSVVGGTSGSILFINSLNQLAQDNAAFFWNDTNNWLGIGTGSPDSPVSIVQSVLGSASTFGLHHTITWNTSGAPVLWQADITDTASSGNSFIANFTVNSSAVWQFRKDGAMFTPVYISHDNQSVAMGSQYVTGVTIGANASLGFTNNAWNNSIDVKFQRDGSQGTLAVYDPSPGAIAFRIYNTPGANFERFSIDWQTSANVARLRSEANGSGTVRIIAIDGFIKAGAAVAADIPASTWALIHDSSGGTTKLVYNDGGTLRTVALV